jgi:2-keto-4-pentenoate hydratase
MNWLTWQGHLDAPAVRSYAEAFAEARPTGSATLPRFSASNPAADLGDAFAAQRRIVRQAIRNGGRVAGYKGALTSTAAQAAFGIDHLLHGVLFESGRIESSSREAIAIDTQQPMLVETEIGYVIATDIGAKLRVPRQALTTIEAVVPVIELPTDVRPLMDGTASGLDLTAANIGSGRFIVGTSVAPTSLGDLDALPISLRRDGMILHEATGADTRGGQAAALMALINQIVEQGRVIHAGEIILSGALGSVQPAAAGEYSATFGPLGTIDFRLE